MLVQSLGQHHQLHLDTKNEYTTPAFTQTYLHWWWSRAVTFHNIPDGPNAYFCLRASSWKARSKEYHSPKIIPRFSFPIT